MKTKLVWICSLFVFLVLSACSNKSSEPPAGTAPPTAPVAATPSPIPGYDIVQVADGGSISGVISVSGDIPKLPTRKVNKDPKVCGTAARESLNLIVGTGGGLKNAIVMVQGVKRGKPVPASFQNAQIDQKNCEYAPHVLVMPVTAEVAVLNSDPLLHNIHFYQNDESLFNIAQPTQNQVDKRKLDKAGMVYAECDVHGWMQGHVAVVDNPYYAITDENGKFTIADLPAGTYKVKVWHEYLGEKTQDMTVNAKADTALNLDLKDLLAAKAPASTSSTGTPASGGAAGDKKAGGEVVVKMVSDGTNFRYDPAQITVKVGTTVRWMNASENKHTATDDPELEKKPGEAELPKGAKAFTSPFLNEGGAFTQTFTVPGKYRYFCRNHGQFGMEGTITVVP